MLAVVFSEAAGYLITDDEVGGHLDGGGRVILLGAALLSADPPLVMWRCAALRLAGRISILALHILSSLLLSGLRCCSANAPRRLTNCRPMVCRRHSSPRWHRLPHHERSRVAHVSCTRLDIFECNRAVDCSLMASTSAHVAVNGCSGAAQHAVPYAAIKAAGLASCTVASIVLPSTPRPGCVWSCR